MSANLFDVNYYRQVNPDLAGAGLTNDAQLTEHFFNFGLDQGRTFSRFVDLNYYRASNPDLPANGINTFRALYGHLDNSGILEGRRFSRYTDLSFYRQANQDLAALNLNNDRLFDHLQAFGLNEGRRFSPFFDLVFYRGANSDLAPLNFNQTQLFDHLRNFGLDNPGRPVSQFLNLDFYNTVNPDLAKAGLVAPRQLFNHFEDSGIFENRRSSPFSDLDFYKFANPDVAAGLVNTDLFGNINLETFRNLQTTGLRESRRISPFIDINIYRQSNLDLFAVNLSNYDLLNHLEIYGLNEERRISNSFDPKIYRANNPDLAGLRGASLLNHFAVSGINEPSIIRGASSDIFNVNLYRTSNPDLAAAGINTDRAALNHYEAYGFKENRRASNLPLSLPFNPGGTLNTATILGFLTRDRIGTLSQQRLAANNAQNYYRFNTSAVTNLNVQVASLTGALTLDLIFDANNNGQVDAGEVMQTSRITAANKGINLVIGPGTYFARVTNGINGVNNYRLNFNATAEAGVTLSIDPANTSDGSFTLGSVNTTLPIKDFIGSSDRNDYYYFNTSNGALGVRVLNYKAQKGELGLTLIEDVNGNGIIDPADTSETKLSNAGVISIDRFPLTKTNYFVLVSTNKPNVNTSYKLELNIG